MKITCEISTEYTVSYVKDTLNSISLKERSISNLLSNKYLIGTIENSQFYYKTYNSPPIEIKGEIREEEAGSRLFLNIQSDSMEGQLKALTYALCYPVIFGFILLAIIKNPYTILTYVISAFALLLPVIIHKFYILFFYHKPNPEYIITKLSNNLKGQIENRKQQK